MRQSNPDALVHVEKMRQCTLEIERIRDNLHEYTCRFLSKNKVVLLPKFHSSNDLVKKKYGELNKESKSMNCLAHGQFRTSLEHKMSLTGNQVVYVSEADTTKT